MESSKSRYHLVSRRALLKASAGIGAALVLPSCGNDDVQIFAGTVTDPVSGGPTAGSTPVATTPPLLPEPAATVPEAEPTSFPESSADENAATDSPANEDPAASEAAANAEVAPTATPVPAAAIAGELVIAFTYTQAAGGKNERPYVAVWLESEAGELVETIALWYEQGRRGERWLDHLDRWWERDQARIAAGGTDDAAVISAATRQAGSFAVAWDGTVAGALAPPGRYFICIESAREEGPYSLVREVFDLTGTLPETALPDSGELSSVAVWTSV